MIYDPAALAPAISFHRLRDDAIWLEELLAKNKIPIRADSELAEALGLAKRLPDLSDAPPTEFDPRSLAAPLGLLYLSRALQDAQHNASFERICLLLLPRLALKAGVPAAVNSKQSNERDLVFELEMAAVLASLGATVVAEEPDITFTHEGSTWDVACKLIYSPNAMTLNDRIEEGIAQTLQAASDYALVFIGITNRVDHSQFLPLLVDDGNQYWGVFPNGDAAVTAMRQTLRKTAELVVAEQDARFFHARETTKFRGIITVLHAVVGLDSVATLLTATGFIPRAELFGEIVTGPEEQLVKRLNDRMQEVFAG